MIIPSRVRQQRASRSSFSERASGKSVVRNALASYFDAAHRRRAQTQKDVDQA